MAGCYDHLREYSFFRETSMLSTIIVVLIVLWALGLATATAGNLIHILLVIAVIVVLLRVIQGRNPLKG